MINFNDIRAPDMIRELWDDQREVYHRWKVSIFASIKLWTGNSTQLMDEGQENWQKIVYF